MPGLASLLVVVLVILLAALVVLLIVVGMRTFARKLYARLVVREDGLVASGVATTARVSDVPGASRGWSRNGGYWRQVTFTFHDASGGEHAVARRMLIRSPGQVKVGDVSRLWYDAAAPQDGTRIVVELEKQSRPVRS
jgi:hypothetical protein